MFNSTMKLNNFFTCFDNVLVNGMSEVYMNIENLKYKLRQFYKRYFIPFLLLGLTKRFKYKVYINEYISLFSIIN